VPLLSNYEKLDNLKACRLLEGKPINLYVQPKQAVYDEIKKRNMKEKLFEGYQSDEKSQQDPEDIAIEIIEEERINKPNYTENALHLKGNMLEGSFFLEELK
jgi:hypothetical protein